MNNKHTNRPRFRGIVLLLCALGVLCGACGGREGERTTEAAATSAPRTTPCTPPQTTEAPFPDSRLHEIVQEETHYFDLLTMRFWVLHSYNMIRCRERTHKKEMYLMQILYGAAQEIEVNETLRYAIFKVEHKAEFPMPEYRIDGEFYALFFAEPLTIVEPNGRVYDEWVITDHSFYMQKRLKYRDFAGVHTGSSIHEVAQVDQTVYAWVPIPFGSGNAVWHYIEETGIWEQGIHCFNEKDYVNYTSGIYSNLEMSKSFIYPNYIFTSFHYLTDGVLYIQFEYDNAREEYYVTRMQYNSAFLMPSENIMHRNYPNYSYADRGERVLKILPEHYPPA